MRSAISVPRWSITLNASESMKGSRQPSTAGTMIRWPELEIGRNSVSPCTIPSTTACKRRSIGAFPGRPSCVTIGRQTGLRLPDEQRREDEGDRREQLHEDVERRTGSVLEWV